MGDIDRCLRVSTHMFVVVSKICSYLSFLKIDVSFCLYRISVHAYIYMSVMFVYCYLVFGNRACATAFFLFSI